ncbi:TonB-dependent receptor domain-containing protein [Sphingomonas sp. ERG5]|uniref:TonB-dependent receptor domain-containing protein n=1 Tax=Sphingomonas sp. ERG5 TaxID=1381597 RepID=UPI00054BF61E|nr:TonB-dependent receptor [Sphingomonas sp. ERG5]
MSKPLSLASLLLVSTALVSPAAFAQDAAPGGATQSATPAADPATAADPAPQEEPADVSIPGGGNPGADIVVTTTRSRNLIRTTPQVVSVLSSADIARTGEGDIAGALQRVTGLSVVGNGFVYVRGLGDRYSLALLNGSPLPSPEPLKRVVPLDIFPTSVIASSFVQKSYSANFPGEFGGGVINLTTKAIPRDAFLSVGASVSGDTVTTGQLGYTYAGSKTDWTGFDNGTRTIPTLFQNALSSGNLIAVGEHYTTEQIGLIASSLSNARTTVLQRNNNMPVNFSGEVTGGGSIDLGGAELGLIATASLSNTWRTRQTLQQTAGAPDLSIADNDFTRVITDNRVVASGLIGAGLEFGENKIRWTNLYIRDTLKQGSLAVGNRFISANRDLLVQNTAWYERQLIDTQLTGEFKFDKFSLDLRGGYANTQREAPYERSFTYVRTNQASDPTGNKFVNDLGGNNLEGVATVSFSDLNENLYSAGADLSYRVAPGITGTVGYAFTDTGRTSTRRDFTYRGSNLPISVRQLRPDYLLSDYTIQAYDIVLLETSGSAGTAAFDAKLRTHAGYGQLKAEIIPGLKADLGVRYETAKQTVVPIDLFGNGAGSIVSTNLNNDYWLPAATLTWEVAKDVQVRVSGSKTIARPQFRELVSQIYLDTDSNRQFRGNPSLVDSKLTNAEARAEWFFARDQRVTLGGFYKKIDRPIETFSSFNSDGSVNTSFANAPKATLYGAEFEAQKYFSLADMFGGSKFFSPRRLLLVANYTYSKSKIKVGPNDLAVINGVSQSAANLFRDGQPLTGQSDHLINLQIGMEDTDKLSQFTFLANYASKRVTSRGPSGQPDIYEKPGIEIDFVARQGVKMFGLDTEIKFTARNILATKYQEYQQLGGNKIFYNRYNVGARFSLGIGVNF